MPSAASAEKVAARAVILAAGLGTRMRSEVPKGLQHLGGKTMLGHLLDTLSSLPRPLKIQVVAATNNLQALRTVAGERADDIDWAVQRKMMGTGHAVRCALEELDEAQLVGPVLVLFADVPLIRAATIEALLDEHWSPGGLALLSMELDDPNGYGRIIRDNTGALLGVVEQADASELQARLKEVNTGVLAADAAGLLRWLQAMPMAPGREYYLPDVIVSARAEGAPLAVHRLADPREAFGANNKAQLHALERYWQMCQADELMRAGVWIADANRLDIRGEVEIGRDSFLDVGVVLEGKVKIGAGVHVGPGCVIRDSSIADGVEIRAYTCIEGAEVAEGATLGPYARLRPGTRVGRSVRIGNFVETKNATFAEGAKASHLSYVGDSEVGAEANLGAGVITCNYDGKDKHRTRIGERAFVGSNTALVAPVELAEGARVGAGSVISRDVGPGELAVSRARQKNLPSRVRAAGQDGAAASGDEADGDKGATACAGDNGKDKNPRDSA